MIPCIRHPNNAVENLVVAHESCNRSKNDLFATPEHLERWTSPLEDRQDIGTELGRSYSTNFFGLARSVGIACRGYQFLPDGFPLWRQRQPGHGQILVPLSCLYTVCAQCSTNDDEPIGVTIGPDPDHVRSAT